MKHLSIILKVIIFFLSRCWTTIDLNAAHFQYLADHLRPEECRLLVAALHFQTFNLPNGLLQAERRVPKDLTCLEQLLHWNAEPRGGHGKAHEVVARRLKQINRQDLAAWLTQAAFETVQREFQRGVADSFKMYQPIHLPSLNWSTPSAFAAVQDDAVIEMRITTPVTLIRVAKQDVVAPGTPGEEVLIDPTEWTIFDTISWSIVIFLFLLVIVLLVYLTMASPCCNKKKRFEKEAVHTGTATGTDMAAGGGTGKYANGSAHSVIQQQQQQQQLQQQQQRPPYGMSYPVCPALQHADYGGHKMYQRSEHGYAHGKPDHGGGGGYMMAKQMEHCAPCQRESMKQQQYEQQAYAPCMVPPPPRPICQNAMCPAKEFNDMRTHSHYNGTCKHHKHKKYWNNPNAMDRCDCFLETFWNGNK